MAPQTMNSHAPGERARRVEVQPKYVKPDRAGGGLILESRVGGAGRNTLRRRISPA